MPLEANDEWLLQHRYMQVEAIAQRSASEGADGIVARRAELTTPLIEIEGEVTPDNATTVTLQAVWPVATSATPQIPPR